MTRVGQEPKRWHPEQQPLRLRRRRVDRRAAAHLQVPGLGIPLAPGEEVFLHTLEFGDDRAGGYLLVIDFL